MRLNPPDLDISENSPFDPDHLKREPHIKYLTQFVSTIRETVLGKDITKVRAS